jgi:fructokinase
MSGKRYGLVEAGGTKFVLGVATDDTVIEAAARVDTTTPQVTISAMLEWFGTVGPIDAIGVASFGPLELDPASPHWGHITTTTKTHWSGADIAGPLHRTFGCPVAIDTDVNGAALAEYLWGAGQGQKSMLYFTVGTGIGGGAIIDGRILQGLTHPEMGHIRLPLHPRDLPDAGYCPFHGACLEGLASGPAIMKRWGASLSDLPPHHEAHGIIAFYLAQAVVTMQSIFEPGRIIFGGGVMGTPGLIDRVRQEATTLGGGYFRGDPAELVVLPGLGDKAGLLGALALAQSKTERL